MEQEYLSITHTAECFDISRNTASRMVAKMEKAGIGVVRRGRMVRVSKKDFARFWRGKRK